RFCAAAVGNLTPGGRTGGGPVGRKKPAAPSPVPQPSEDDHAIPTPIVPAAPVLPNAPAGPTPPVDVGDPRGNTGDGDNLSDVRGGDDHGDDEELPQVVVRGDANALAADASFP